jgi:hypothetical protein
VDLKGSVGKDESWMGKGGKTHAGPGEPGGEVVERFHRQEAGIGLKIEHPVFINSHLQSRGKSMEKHDAQRQKERKQRLNANVAFCCCCCYELNVKREKTLI